MSMLIRMVFVHIRVCQVETLSGIPLLTSLFQSKYSGRDFVFNLEERSVC